MTDDQMRELTRQFETISRRFDAVDQRLDAVDQRLDTVDRRLDRVDRRLDRVDGQLTGLNTRLESLDTEVHRQGILLDANKVELHLAIDSFQGLQRITLAKIDDLRESFDRRTLPLELASRAHSDQLAEHARRLDALGE